MTNTTQTDLLDGVEPDGFINTSGNLMTLAAMKQHLENPDYKWAVDKYWTPSKKVFSEDKVEALLEANRKQVLLDAAEVCGKNMDRCAELEKKFGDDTAEAYAVSKKLYNELHRMALEPTGVDKGEKE
jgi:hypothetical protein